MHVSFYSYNNDNDNFVYGLHSSVAVGICIIPQIWAWITKCMYLQKFGHTAAGYIIPSQVHKRKFVVQLVMRDYTIKCSYSYIV